MRDPGASPNFRGNWVWSRKSVNGYANVPESKGTQSRSRKKGLNECNERATVACRKERRKSEVEHADMPQPKWTQSRSKKNNQRSVVSMPMCRKVYKRNQAAILYSQLLTKRTRYHRHRHRHRPSPTSPPQHADDAAHASPPGWPSMSPDPNRVSHQLRFLPSQQSPSRFHDPRPGLRRRRRRRRWHRYHTCHNRDTNPRLWYSRSIPACRGSRYWCSRCIWDWCLGCQASLVASKKGRGRRPFPSRRGSFRRRLSQRKLGNWSSCPGRRRRRVQRGRGRGRGFGLSWWVRVWGGWLGYD